MFRLLGSEVIRSFNKVKDQYVKYCISSKIVSVFSTKMSHANFNCVILVDILSQQMYQHTYTCVIVVFTVYKCIIFVLYSYNI